MGHVTAGVCLSACQQNNSICYERFEWSLHERLLIVIGEWLMTFWRDSRRTSTFDLPKMKATGRVTICGGNDLLVRALPISSSVLLPPATRSFFPASFCYEVKIIDWEHREPSRRQRVRRGGAQGEKQIDKKGIKKARREEDVGSERDGVSKYRGGWGMKECANLKSGFTEKVNENSQRMMGR